MSYPSISNLQRDALKICVIHDEAIEVTQFLFTPKVPLERPVLFEIIRATDAVVKDEEESKPNLEVTEATEAVAQHASHTSQAAPAPAVAPVTPVVPVPSQVVPAPQKATQAALLTPVSPLALRAGEGASVPARNATPGPSEQASTSRVRKLASPATRRARAERAKRARLDPFDFIPDISQGISQASHEYLLARVHSLPTSMTDSNSEPEMGVQAKKARTG